LNTLGPIVLFSHKLLLASPTNAPTFALISTAVASISHYAPFSASAYGSSKAAAHFLVKALDAENFPPSSLVIHPGWVATDMGNTGVTTQGMPQAPVSTKDSVAGILSRIDGAMREKTGGRFWNF
ncbi:hypothetical protein B0H14DRAFT_2323244, partial [Mycena olivaceomarginata]